MNKTTATIAALLLAACGATKDDPAQQYREALPQAATAHVGTYQDAGAGTTAAVGVAQQALGDSDLVQSEYAVQSYWLAVSVNWGAKSILDLVQFITRFPTTACDETSCTWGPWVGDQGLNNYKLVVTKDGAEYVYALSGQNAQVADSPWVAFLTGRASPVDRDHGSGSFELDFDANYSGLAHAPNFVRKDYGLLAVTYDNTIQSPYVGATFIGAREEDNDQIAGNDKFVDAAYLFEAKPSGGQLQVAFYNRTTGDSAKLRTRWGANGQGRADAIYVPAVGNSVTASECWLGRSQSWAEAYDTKHLNDERLQDANACSPFDAFLEAELSVPQP